MSLKTRPIASWLRAGLAAALPSAPWTVHAQTAQVLDSLGNSDVANLTGSPGNISCGSACSAALATGTAQANFTK